jgi:hypothetical protein
MLSFFLPRCHKGVTLVIPYNKGDEQLWNLKRVIASRS